MNLTQFDSFKLFTVNPLSKGMAFTLSEGMDRNRGNGNTTNYKGVCWLHANRAGFFQFDRNAKIALQAEYVICCYPYMARIRYPELSDKILGNWDEVTHTNFHKVDNNRYVVMVLPERYYYLVGKPEIDSIPNVSLF